MEDTASPRSLQPVSLSTSVTLNHCMTAYRVPWLQEHSWSVMKNKSSFSFSLCRCCWSADQTCLYSIYESSSRNEDPIVSAPPVCLSVLSNHLKNNVNLSPADWFTTASHNKLGSSPPLFTDKSSWMWMLTLKTPQNLISTLCYFEWEWLCGLQSDSQQYEKCSALKNTYIKNVIYILKYLWMKNYNVNICTKIEDISYYVQQPWQEMTVYNKVMVTLEFRCFCVMLSDCRQTLG